MLRPFWALLPLAFASGEGANQRIAMGVAVVGGMLVSTFLTMYIVPAIYSYISTNRAKKKKMKKRLYLFHDMSAGSGGITAQYTYTLKQCLEEGLANNYSPASPAKRGQIKKNNATLEMLLLA